MQENSLDKIITYEKEARDFGFEWSNVEMILDQVISEVQEVREAIAHSSKEHIQEEIGDVLHTAISLCRFMGFDTHETLEKTADKFEKRIENLKKIMGQKNLENLHGQTDRFKIELWNEAKKT